VKLFEATRWGNRTDGADGPDTNYLVCALDHLGAESLVTAHEPALDAISELGVCGVEVEAPVILRGPYLEHKLERGTFFTLWSRESPSGHGAELWVPHPRCRDGEATCHYLDGQLAARSGWQAGRQHGPCHKWYATGQLMHSGEYRRGQRTGIHDWWYPDGGRASHYQYRADGVAYQTWNLDGTLASEGNETWPSR